MDAVKTHYASPDLSEKIRAGLQSRGQSPESIVPRDLAAVDQLHTGGAPATISLMNKWTGQPETGSRTEAPVILDAGCGTGGSSRLLADRFNCRVTGVDLSGDFIDAARTLTQWCRLDDRVSFKQGSVLDLPFKDGAFDGVLCQHILMNIQDKAGAVAEFHRVIKPGGSLILHDITKGEGPEPVMPVPWASDPCTSFLVPWETLETLLSEAGFRPVHISDDTDAGAAWWQSITSRKKPSAPPALHPGLVFGKNARHFGPNMAVNFSSRAVCCISAIYSK